MKAPRSLNRAHSVDSSHALVLLMCAGLTPVATAASGSWKVNAAGGWENAANWAGDPSPSGTGDSAALSFDITAARAVSLNGDRTLGALTLGDPTSSYFGYSVGAGTPGSSRLVFDQTGIAPATLSYPVTASTAVNTISAPILLRDDLAITSSVTTTAAQSISGIVSDDLTPQSLSLSGTGIITLSNANAYRGGTSINGGKITASNVLSFGTGAVQVASGGQAHLSAINGPYANDFTLAGSGFGIVETADTHQLGAIRYVGALTTGTITVAPAGARIGAGTGTVGLHLGPLSGSGNLETNGTATAHEGLIVLAGPASSMTGTLTARKGTLRLHGDLGGSLASVAGSRLHLHGAVPAAAAPTIGTDTGAARSLALGGGTLVLDPAATQMAAVAGDLTLSGTQTISFSSPHPGTTMGLLSYTGTLTGSAANFDLPGGLASYRAGTGFSITPGSPNVVELSLVSASRSWSNAAGGNWNPTDANWDVGTYANGDNVSFGDFDANAGSVTVTLPTGATLAPNSIVFDNSLKSYTLSGAGKLGGTAAITKNGSGAVVVSNTGGNDFTGGITVNDGSLYLVPSATLGTSQLTLTGGRMASATTAALVLNANSAISGGVTLGDSTTGRTGGVTVNGLHAIATGSTIAVSLPVNVSFTGRTLLPQAVQFHTPFAGAQNATLSYSGLIELAGDTTLNATAAFNSNNIVNFNGRLSDGAGSHRLIKQGIGAVRLSAPNAYDGGTEIEGGTLIAANPGAYGSGPVNVLDGAQAFLLTGGTYANPFSITGLGQTVNGLNNTSPDGAIHINTSGVNLSGPITLTGNARIAGFFSSNSIISSNIGEDENGPWLLELGSPGAANGNGTFTLTGENTYGGGTAIHRITLRARGNKVFGSGPVTLTGGGSTTLQTRLEVGDVTLPNDILLDTTGRTNSTAATQTWGAITGFPGDNTTPSTAVIDGDVEIFSSVANGGHFAAQGHPTDSILRINGEVVSNVVPVTVAAGVVEFGGGGSYADLHHYQGTLKLAAANGLSTGAILTQGHQGASVFDLNGRNQSLVALARAGSGAASVTNNGGTAATLTLAPGSGATHAYSGSFVTGASPLNLSVGGSNGSVVSLGGDSSQFAGTTTVTSGGTLEITGYHGGAGSTLVVQSGATLAGTGTIGGNLTLNSGARLRVNPTAGTLNIAGNLTVIGTATIEFTGTPGASNVIYTVNGTNNSTSGQYAILNPGNYNSPQFNIAGNQLVLTTGVLNLTWTGTGGTTWNINGTSNWTNGTAAFKFLNGYAVNFTDAPASDPLIGVAATVQPSSITFANSARNYAFTNTGAGRIQTTTLVKNGSGRAGFEVPLEVSGTIALNGGTLLLSSPESGPTEPDIAAAVTGTGTLEIAAGYLNPLTLAGDNSGFSGPLVISREEVKIAATAATGAGPLVFGSEGTTGIDVPQLTLLAGVAIQNPVTMGSFADTARISGAGSLAGGASVTVAGTGLLELGTVNSYSGDTTIVDGTLWGTVIGAIPATSTVVFGSAASGAVDTVLQLPPAASADQTVLSSPLSLSAAAPDSSAIVRRVSGQLARITGEVSLNGRPIIAGSGGIHFAGRISGDGDLVVENGGGEAVRISHPANDFTGDVRVNNGAFRNAAAESIPDAADVIIGDFGTFEVGADETVERLQGTANSLVRPASGTVDLTLGSGGSSFDFGGSFTDNGTSVIHLNKAGTGTLTLSGASTSTGRLRVLQGRVDVTGSIASRIEVGAAGILGGTGIIQFPGQGAGLAPVFGRIAPGTAATVGTLDLRNALSFQTGAGIDIGIADWSGTTPGTTHGLLLSPQIVFGGGSFTLRVDATGMTGFTEAPRTFVIATANQQVFPPGINVQQVVTTGFPGTGTWTVTSSGNNLLLNYQPSSGYASWIGGYPTLSGNAALPGSDPDQDGLANVLEYVLGGNPTLSSAAVAPTGAVQGDDFVVRYFRSDASESDTQQTVWWSPDLLTWTPVGIPAASAGMVTVQENGGAADEVIVAIPRNGGSRIFTRLEATPNP